jgi:hypothetical protein
MAKATIKFQKKLNVSLQPGDIIYMRITKTTPIDPELEAVGDNSSQIVTLGTCFSVASDRLSLVVDTLPASPRPEIGNYFMFGKNNVINSSSVIGYHANIEFENTSTDFCELYAVNSEISYSSN